MPKKLTANKVFHLIESLMDKTLERVERNILKMSGDIHTVKCSGKLNGIL